jgi:hypothetical protein
MVKRRIISLLLALFVLLTSFGIVTWAALESREVVILHTRGSDGVEKATRVWIADEGGYSWLESPTTERIWYRHVLENPSVTIERGGRMLSYTAEPMPGPEGHARIRTLFRAKYGWADVWVAFLQDTSLSIAVRLQ